jgi:hypothetical protein
MVVGVTYLVMVFVKTRYLDEDTGYIRLYLSDGSIVFEHRWLVEQYFGRPLLPEERVHHIDKNPSNNIISNFILLSSNEEHCIVHSTSYGHTHPCEWCGKETHNDHFCSKECTGIAHRRVERPTKDELESLLKTTTCYGLGKRFGVSDKSVYKWARAYGII